jgi:8-oxo-dGTP pyrophosphatase MutT (NUDIX family)
VGVCCTVAGRRRNPAAGTAIAGEAGREDAEKGVNMAVSVPRPSAPEFQPARLAATLAARLPQTPPQSGGRDDYHVDATVPLALGGTRAAVLLPLIAAAEPVLLFTRRTETLARHSGQVSFPGGRVEPDDVSPMATALRETAEETGIAGAHVHVVGYLPRYRTGTGFDIQPVVGVLQPGFILKPDPAEVAAVFEVPLAFFADPANRRRASREWNGHVRSFYTYTYGGHEIWGATAAMIVDLVTRLGVISL